MCAQSILSKDVNLLYIAAFCAVFGTLAPLLKGPKAHKYTTIRDYGLICVAPLSTIFCNDTDVATTNVIHYKVEFDADNHVELTNYDVPSAEPPVPSPPQSFSLQDILFWLCLSLLAIPPPLEIFKPSITAGFGRQCLLGIM